MVGIIIQARMGSTRLPGKVLAKLGDKTLLEHIFFRLGFLQAKTTVVLATSESEKDEVIEEFCRKRGLNCFRGSDNNVLERYFLCAKSHGFDHIVRLTADNPFTDIDELDRLIEMHLETKADYSHSFSSLPVGVGAEIFTMEALERSYHLGKARDHLEHVDEYILQHPGEFKISVLAVAYSKKRPDIRLTVDTVDDLAKADFIVTNSPNAYISTEEAIEICTRYA